MIKRFFSLIFILSVLLSAVSCTQSGSGISTSTSDNANISQIPVGESNTTEGTSTEETTTVPEKKITLKIGSYNIANGRDVEHDMKKIANDVKGKNLDIIGFQEVDRFASRSKFIDTMKLLSEYTGLEYYYYTKAINLKGDPATYGQEGEYGTGILSRYPILEGKSISLESGDKEQRMLSYAKIDIEGTHINFFNTHLAHDDSTIRAVQFMMIAEEFKDKDYCFVTGDFNVSGFEEYNAVSFLNHTCNKKNFLVTIPKNGKCIDNILYSNEFTLVKSKVLNNSHSDHNLLYADFTFTPKEN